MHFRDVIELNKSVPDRALRMTVYIIWDLPGSLYRGCRSMDGRLLESTSGESPGRLDLLTNKLILGGK